jgi:hypothetical protein
MLITPIVNNYSVAIAGHSTTSGYNEPCYTCPCNGCVCDAGDVPMQCNTIVAPQTEMKMKPKDGSNDLSGIAAILLVMLIFGYRIR